MLQDLGVEMGLSTSKSTLVRVLCGLVPHVLPAQMSGTVRVAGYGNPLRVFWAGKIAGFYWHRPICN